MAEIFPKSTKVTSSHWGAFEVDVEQNRIIATRPFHADPHPSRIPDILSAAVHHDTRVARPSIRRGWLETRKRDGRGSDDFVERALILIVALQRAEGLAVIPVPPTATKA